jgi:hypothetical protein
VALFVYKLSKGSYFFRDFKRRHPDRALCSQLDKLVTVRCKLTKARARLRFLDECIEHGVYTQHLRQRITQNRLKPSSEVCERFLQTEKTDVSQQLQHFQSVIVSLCSCLKNLGLLDFCRYSKFTKSAVEKTRTSVTKKFQGILAASVPTLRTTGLDRHIINLSSHQLTITEKQALRWGLDFRIPPKHVPRIPLEAEIEQVYTQLQDLKPKDDGDVSVLKTSLVHTSNSYRRSPIEKGGLLPQHIAALAALKKNREIVILRPDKGNGVVLLNRRDYVSKMNTILSDTSKFELDSKQCDSNKSVESTLSSLLNHLVSSGFLTKRFRSALMSSGHDVPRLYGLPKTHKPGYPLRPILSMSGSPTHKTAAWLAELLKPVKDFFSKYSLNDSFEFVNIIRNQDLTNCTMTSFDVTSLFTSVPVKETIDIILTTISDNNIDMHGIDLNTLRSLLEVCTCDVQFLFDGKYYRQVDGVAMGSCLGPIFAEIFMGFLESKLSSHISNSCDLFVRYVDDCFLLLKHDTNLADFLHALNSVHPGIRYTFEVEVDNKLSFLDVSCTRKSDGSVLTSVFRKKTWTGLYNSFYSFVPRCYKVSVVRSLVTRAVKICSPECLDAELTFVRQVLMDNGYPPFFLDRYMIVKESVPKMLGPERKPIFLKVPFIGDKAASFFRRSLRQCLSVFPAARPVVIFQTSNIPVASPKDRLPVQSQHNCIYSFACTCGCRYVGRTERRLDDRIREHVPKWLASDLKCPPRSTRIPASAITRHLQVCDCPADVARSRFSVLFSARHCMSLRFLEALAIKRFAPDLCVQKEHVLSLNLPW